MAAQWQRNGSAMAAQWQRNTVKIHERS